MLLLSFFYLLFFCCCSHTVALLSHHAPVAVPACTRPVINHWLKKESLKNESITLFGDHPAHQKDIYLSYDHGECITARGGRTRLFCNGYTFSIDCVKADFEMKPEDMVLGLGRKSVLWNHYSRMILTEDTVTFGDSNLKFDETYGAKLQCSNSAESESLCVHEHGQLIYGDTSETVVLELFSDSNGPTVPPKAYSHIILGAEPYFHYSIMSDSEVFKCGKNCMWVSDLWKDSNLLLHRGTKNTLRLGALSRQKLKVSYDAYNNYVHIEALATSTKYSKLISQVILIVKLGVLCFAGSTSLSAKYNSNLGKFLTTVAVFLAIEFLIFADTLLFKITGLCQVTILIALHLYYTDSYGLGSQPHTALVSLILIQSTLIELSFFELSTLALLTHTTVTVTMLTKCWFHESKQLAALFMLVFVISVFLTLDVLEADIDQFQCLFGLSSSSVLFAFFIEICIALSIEWTLRGL